MFLLSEVNVECQRCLHEMSGRVKEKGVMSSLILLVVLGTTIWMAVDARAAGRTWGSVGMWILGAFLLWIAVFPYYLVDRRKFFRGRDKDDTFWRKANHDNYVPR